MGLKLTLTRLGSSAHGTIGILSHGNQHLGYTLEPPWQDNKVNISCIPTGRYHCTRVDSPKFGKTYGVHNVPGRSHILFHAGNIAGDTARGLNAHSHGCILLGRRFGRIKGQKAVLESRLALNEFDAHMNKQDFELIVKDL